MIFHITLSSEICNTSILVMQSIKDLRTCGRNKKIVGKTILNCMHATVFLLLNIFRNVFK